MCDHSFESHWEVHLIILYKVVITFESAAWMKSNVWSFKWKFSAEQYFPVVLFIMLYKVVLTFESVVEILMCDHSNESSVLRSTFLWYTVYSAIQGGPNF